MSAWRVIITDSESLSGVAPVCPSQNDYTKHSTGDGFMKEPADVAGIYDCCPGPHIECWSEQRAEAIAKALTEAEAEICS